MMRRELLIKTAKEILSFCDVPEHPEVIDGVADKLGGLLCETDYCPYNHEFGREHERYDDCDKCADKNFQACGQAYANIIMQYVGPHQNRSNT